MRSSQPRFVLMLTLIWGLAFFAVAQVAFGGSSGGTGVPGAGIAPGSAPPGSVGAPVQPSASGGTPIGASGVTLALGSPYPVGTRGWVLPRYTLQPMVPGSTLTFHHEEDPGGNDIQLDVPLVVYAALN